MLIAALALTVAGFAALVAAVATGNLAFAWVCIGAGILGVLLLVIDAVIGVIRRGSRPDSEDVDSRGSEISAPSGI